MKINTQSLNVSQKELKTIENIWQEVKDTFQTMKDWYDSKELYHKIGYLIATDADKLQNLIKISKENTKSGFNSYLNEKIQKSLPSKEKLDELDYNIDRAEIKKVLLYHNVATMNCNKNDSARFPFDKYKLGKWDIEHIQSSAEEMPIKLEEQKQWLEIHKEYIKNNEELLSRIESFDDKEKFPSIYEEIAAEFKAKEIEKDSIGNLALLNSSINRGYKNVFFPIKRNTIIEKEKEGSFIPICTRNIFLKYYNDVVEDVYFWHNKDMENYKRNIELVLYPKETGDE